MINISEGARQILRDILDEALRQQRPYPLGGQPDGAPEPGLRLLIEEDGASFALDYPQSDDQVIAEDGRSLLIIGADIEEILGDSTIDIIHTPDGEQLSIQRELPSNGHAKEAA